MMRQVLTYRNDCFIFVEASPYGNAATLSLTQRSLTLTNPKYEVIPNAGKFRSDVREFFFSSFDCMNRQSRE